MFLMTCWFLILCLLVVWGAEKITGREWLSRMFKSLLGNEYVDEGVSGTAQTRRAGSGMFIRLGPFFILRVLQPLPGAHYLAYYPRSEEYGWLRGNQSVLEQTARSVAQWHRLAAAPWAMLCERVRDE